VDRLKIFISSTMKDLQPERDAVEKAISTFRFETVRAETIGAQPLSSREACLEMARECDIYIGIYGGRYGWIPPGDQFSVTEMEFREARRQGKDILIYVKEGEREERGQEFIRRVEDFHEGYFRRPYFTNPEQLAEWVMEDLAALVSRRYGRPPAARRAKRHDDDIFVDLSHAQNSWQHRRKSFEENLELLKRIADDKKWNVQPIREAEEFAKPLPPQAVLLLPCPRGTRVKPQEMGPDEIMRVADFVHSGGCLLALGYYSLPHHRTNFDRLMNRFGFRFEHNLLLPPGAAPVDARHQAFGEGEKYVVKISTAEMRAGEPLLKGVNTLGLQSACSLKVYNADPEVVKVVLHSGSEPLIWEPQNIPFDDQGKYWGAHDYIPSTAKERPLIVKRAFGQGKIVAIGTWKVFCDDFVEDDTALQNRRLLTNILDWFKGTEDG
jgi:hypothetical protein